jgi:excisionase family DNA binding protein
MTTKEAADLLRIKERKVYDLAGAGEIPCVRVTGKLLFPRSLVHAWLVRHTYYGAGAESLKPRPSVVAGSHDPMLEWSLREAQTGLATLFDGSVDGLRRLAKGEAIAAGTHLSEADGREWNLDHVARALAGEPVVLIEWAMREQGLIVPAGNPRRIRGIADLGGARVAPRQKEAGSYLLLVQLLARAGMSLEDLVLSDPPARTETEVALAVAEGRADVGFGLLAMARRHGLHFLALAHERYDLVVWRRDYFEPALQRLFEFARSAAFSARAATMDGYDFKGLGVVRYNGP